MRIVQNNGAEIIAPNLPQWNRMENQGRAEQRGWKFFIEAASLGHRGAYQAAARRIKAILREHPRSGKLQHLCATAHARSLDKSLPTLKSEGRRAVNVVSYDVDSRRLEDWS